MHGRDIVLKIAAEADERFEDTDKAMAWMRAEARRLLESGELIPFALDLIAPELRSALHSKRGQRNQATRQQAVSKSPLRHRFSPPRVTQPPRTSMGVTTMRMEAAVIRRFDARYGDRKWGSIRFGELPAIRATETNRAVGIARNALIAQSIMQRFPGLDPEQSLESQMDDGDFGAIYDEVQRWPAERLDKLLLADH